VNRNNNNVANSSLKLLQSIFESGQVVEFEHKCNQNILFFDIKLKYFCIFYLMFQKLDKILKNFTSVNFLE